MVRFERSQEDLLAPVDPFMQRDIVYCRQYVDLQVTITFRHLNLHTDLPLINKWAEKEYKSALAKFTVPVNEIVQSMVAAAHSDFTQSFTVLVNEKVTSFVQIWNALNNEVVLQYDALPGDYMIYFILPSPLPIQMAVLDTCVDYLLHHAEVKRVIATSDIDNEQENELFRKSGFRLVKRTTSSYITENLYIFELSPALKTV